MVKEEEAATRPPVCGGVGGGVRRPSNGLSLGSWQ